MEREIGTPCSAGATRLMLLGAGELGKEVAIEAQRLGLEVIAVDRYARAPAMQVSHRSHVIDMLDAAQLRRVVLAENPHYIVPEIEAIATSELIALESEGYTVVPTARGAQLTMDREGIRRLAAEELGLPTSPYRFAAGREQFLAAVEAVGMPCVVKPVMSSSGKGQSVVRSDEDIEAAWNYARSGARAKGDRVIVEGLVGFDFEITLITVRHRGGTAFCAPIGHLQIDGDYRESWQPQPLSAAALERAQDIAAQVTAALGGQGVFGVELFVCGDRVYFSEVSPRPHDTGLVTLVSQDLSQFALHVRALLGLPIPGIRQLGPSASCALLVEGRSVGPRYRGLAAALAEPDTTVRLFGKPAVDGRRRMGVALARGPDIDVARARARSSVAQVEVLL